MHSDVNKKSIKEQQKVLKRLEKFSRFMDSSISIVVVR